VESIVPDQVDILVLAAHAPDLRGLRPHLGDKYAASVKGLHVCAKTVGIGMPVAGGAAAKRVFQLDPRAVIHLGTCGIYPGLPQYQPHDVLVSSRIDLVDPGTALGRSEFPEPMMTELEPDTMLTAGLGQTSSRARPAPIASTLSRTIDDDAAAQMPQRFNVHAENLEAFAIAHAARLGQKPFTAVLGATHLVGSKGKQDWAQFERQSTIAAADAIITWIANGAAGLKHG